MYYKLSGRYITQVIFAILGRTELLTCKAMENSFTTIRDQAKQLTREYNLQCCYLYYPVLKQHIQYDFEVSSVFLVSIHSNEINIIFTPPLK